MPRKFHRTRGDRKLFLKSVAHNLIMKERMTTTVARAKEIRPLVERYISIGRRGGVSSLRVLLSRLPKQSAEKLFYDIAPRYKERPGGYVRIIKQAKMRKRDSAPQARIELV